MRLLLLLVPVALALTGLACPEGGPVVTQPAPPAEWEEITMEMSVSNVPHGASSCGTDCIGCHGTGANGAPRLVHPERTECLHCHIVLNPTDQ